MSEDNIAKPNHLPEIRFATVSIPDVREQLEGSHRQATATVSRDDTNVDTPRPTPSNRNESNSKPFSNLAAIRSAIESTLGHEPDAHDRAIEEIKGALPELAKLADENKKLDQAISGLPENETHTQPATPEPKPSSHCYLAKLNHRDAQFTPITEAIIEKYPTGATSVIAFAKTEDNRQLEQTILCTAIQLQQKTRARVLVIDSCVDEKSLTRAVASKVNIGFSDLNRSQDRWDQVITSTSFDSIDFLPCGKLSSDSTNFELAIECAAKNFTGSYDYVLLNVGDAHGEIAEHWSRLTHGTFLLISQKNTNRNIAKSAVTQLNSIGSRLIGCIVSDAAQ